MRLYFSWAVFEGTLCVFVQFIQIDLFIVFIQQESHIHLVKLTRLLRLARLLQKMEKYTGNTGKSIIYWLKIIIVEKG